MRHYHLSALLVATATACVVGTDDLGALRSGDDSPLGVQLTGLEWTGGFTSETWDIDLTTWSMSTADRTHAGVLYSANSYASIGSTVVGPDGDETLPILIHEPVFVDDVATGTLTLSFTARVDEDAEAAPEIAPTIQCALAPEARAELARLAGDGGEVRIELDADGACVPFEVGTATEIAKPNMPASLAVTLEVTPVPLAETYIVHLWQTAITYSYSGDHPGEGNPEQLVGIEFEDGSALWLDDDLGSNREANPALPVFRTYGNGQARAVTLEEMSENPFTVRIKDVNKNPLCGSNCVDPEIVSCTLRLDPAWVAWASPPFSERSSHAFIAAECGDVPGRAVEYLDQLEIIMCPQNDSGHSDSCFPVGG